MRTVVQRVNNAKIKVDNKIIAGIGKGLLIFLAVGKDDKDEDLQYIEEKIVNLRIFEDSMGKMNLSVLDIKGEILMVSQFTLYGDCRRGRRPSFTEAAPPEMANEYYERIIMDLKSRGIAVSTGQFQAHMEVELTNDGPVTLILDSNKIL